MSKFKNIIFDFDGTLCDTRRGIISSIQFTYKKIGEIPPKEPEIMKLVGKSLYEIFSILFDTSNDSFISECINYFRDRYAGP